MWSVWTDTDGHRWLQLDGEPVASFCLEISEDLVVSVLALLNRKETEEG